MTVILILSLLLSGVCLAKEEQKIKSTDVSIGIWKEKNCTVPYVVGNIGDLRSEYDFIQEQNKHRLWLTYGKLALINSKNFKVVTSPGFIVESDKNYFAGAITKINLFDNFEFESRNFLGGKNEQGKHIIFARFPTDSKIRLQIYTFMENNYQPDAYAGPQIFIPIGKDGDSGGFYGWYGQSINEKDGHVYDVGAYLAW